MLKVRLARCGYKKHPCYNIVVADARAPRDGRFIEKIGYYHPMKSADDETRIVFDQDKVQKWFDCGAQPTERVVFLLLRYFTAKKLAINNKIEKFIGKYRRNIRMATNNKKEENATE